MTSQGVFNISGNDYINRSIADLLNQVHPVAGAFSGPVASLLRKITGLNNMPELDSTVLSNMTPFGIAYSNNSRVISAASSAALSAFNEESKRKAFRAYHKTVTSEAAWADMAATDRGASYTDYINRQIRDTIDNPLYTTVYDAWDPLETKQVGQYMHMTTANMVRHGLNRNHRRAYLHATELSKSVFDSGGTFDKRDYGHMGRSEVAALAAALTKDTDFLEGVDDTSTANLKNATERLKKTVKNYAEALGPLKDIFGSDIKGILTTVETLTGQTLNQMGPERARQIATMAANKTLSGNFSMGQLVQMSGGLRNAFAKMETSDHVQLSSAIYGAHALDLANANNKPSFMTKDAYASSMTDLIARTAGSRGADQLSMAYSLWSRRSGTLSGAEYEAEYAKLKATGLSDSAIRARLAGTSRDTFDKAFNQLIGSGVSAQEAMLRLGGVSNSFELEQGKAFDAYDNYAQSGKAGLNMVNALYERDSRRVGFSLRGDHNLKSALDRLGVNVTGNDITDIYGDTLSYLNKNMGLLSMSDSARIEYLNNMGATDLQARQMSVVMNTLKNDRAYRPFINSMQARDVLIKQSVVDKNVADRRELLDNLKLSFSGTSSELFSKILGMDTGEGLSTDAVEKMLSSNAAILQSGSPQAKRDTAEMIAAMTTVAAHKYAGRKTAWEDMKDTQRTTYENRIRANTKYSRTSDAYKRWLDSSKLEASDDNYDKFVTAMAQGLHSKADSAYNKELMSLLEYGHGAEGQTSKLYLDTQEALGNKKLSITERKDLQALLVLSKNLDSDHTIEYINGPDGNATAKQRASRIAALREAAKTGGAGKAAAIITNRAIANDLQSVFEAKGGDAVQAFLKSQNIDFSKSTDNIDFEALGTNIDDHIQKLKKDGGNKDAIAQLEGAKDKIFKAINDTPFSKDNINTIADFVEKISKALEQLVGFFKQDEKGTIKLNRGD